MAFQLSRYPGYTGSLLHDAALPSKIASEQGMYHNTHVIIMHSVAISPRSPVHAHIIPVQTQNISVQTRIILVQRKTVQAPVRLEISNSKTVLERFSFDASSFFYDFSRYSFFFLQELDFHIYELRDQCKTHMDGHENKSSFYLWITAN